MPMSRIISVDRSSFSYGNQLSKRILKAGKWRAAMRKQSEKYGDGRIAEGFQFSHLLIGGTWLWIIASVLFAGILHIGAVLSLPHFATKSGWARISEITPVNEIMILPGGVAGKEILPRLAPDIRYAFCRYDLDGGPVRLNVPMASDLWTVSIHNPNGDNFYTISGADVQRGQATFVITQGPEPLVQDDVKDNRLAASQFTIRSAPRTGLVVIRAPLEGAAHAAFIDSLMKTASCGRQPPPIRRRPGTVPVPSQK